MRYPEFLKENGTIGFVAPSFGCNREPYKSAFDNAQKKLAKQGFKLELGPNCYEGCGIGISNTPEKCGKELTEYYCSDSNDVLISCGGGELMCETLDYVDFERIKAARPKWYMGYSDNTNFTFLLTTLCDTAAIYGPCAAAFGQEPWHPAIWDALKTIQGKKLTMKGYDKWEKISLKDEDHPLLPYNVSEPRVLKCHPTKFVEMQGRLIGGCMDILGMLAGTRYDNVANFVEKYNEDGIVWFMEACDLNVLSIRRVLWQLEHAGWFQYVRGFIFGRPYCHGEELMGLDQYEAVTGILDKYNVPIIMDADIGHIAPMMPLICGSFASVKADDKTFEIKMELR
ncbi:MAG: S66 peptidase family protein [Lachnospiraceae bacterium]